MRNKGNYNYIETKCLSCGKSIWDFPSRKRKYCSDCFFGGRKIKCKCLHCGKLFESSKSRKQKFHCYKCAMDFRKGKCRSIMIRKKITDNIPRGDKHYNFKGGVYSGKLYIRIRHSLEMRKWIRAVFTRDNWTCQKCFKRGGHLEAHHIKEFVIILRENNITTFKQALKCKELWDVDNGQTLCLDCHNITKKKYDKDIHRKYK